MDWITAAVQGPNTSSSPVWLSAVLGGVGAMVGGGLTSTVAWRTLSDTKKARKQAAEKDATAIITTALLEAHQRYMNNDVGLDPAPDNFDTWTGYFLSTFGEAEVAVMTLHSEALRRRITASLWLLAWGAYDTQLLHETHLDTRTLAYAAHKDAMACLGANLRSEPLPRPTKTWTAADFQMSVREYPRGAEEDE
ncbi:hypothetical protein AB0L75_35415 [Streptomyces sp. NPDC052101]|uniref:hypothetical protein n=1 Tax=Streptomyces sp. NPDC052101 TaxID=3155763 RepID=UPI00341BB297